jgi:DNA mismatch repair protein MLH1
VRDNGSGIEKQDRLLLGRRYCTSKLASFDDLDAVSTYGFRGLSVVTMRHLLTVPVKAKR